MNNNCPQCTCRSDLYNNSNKQKKKQTKIWKWLHYRPVAWKQSTINSLSQCCWWLTVCCIYPIWSLCLRHCNWTALTFWFRFSCINGQTKATSPQQARIKVWTNDDSGCNPDCQWWASGVNRGWNRVLTSHNLFMLVELTLVSSTSPSRPSQIVGRRLK